MLTTIRGHFLLESTNSLAIIISLSGSRDANLKCTCTALQRRSIIEGSQSAGKKSLFWIYAVQSPYQLSHQSHQQEDYQWWVLACQGRTLQHNSHGKLIPQHSLWSSQDHLVGFEVWTHTQMTKHPCGGLMAWFITVDAATWTHSGKYIRSLLQIHHHDAS